MSTAKWAASLAVALLLSIDLSSATESRELKGHSRGRKEPRTRQGYGGKKGDKKGGGSGKKGGGKSGKNKSDGKKGGGKSGKDKSGKYGKSGKNSEKVGKTSKSGKREKSEKSWRPPTRPPIPPPTPAPSPTCPPNPCYPYEREVLVDFYYKMGGSGWLTKSGWLEPYLHHCSWTGVECDWSTRCVVGLRLPDNNLQGDLSDTTLAEIWTLLYIDLSRQRTVFDNEVIAGIRGRLSNWEFWRLPYLAKLDLHGNLLTDRLPAAVAYLASLRYLDLSDNDMDGPIPMEISAIPGLGVIDLSGNRFSRDIPQELGSMYNLGVLRLERNELSGNLVAGHPICELRGIRGILAELSTDCESGDVECTFPTCCTECF